MLQPKKGTKIVDKEKTGLTPSEQSAINREWQARNPKSKLPKGENASLSEEAYKEWKKTGSLNHTYYDPKPKPEPVKRVEVGKLPTKAVPTPTKPSMAIIKSKDVVVNGEKEKGKFTPTAKTKRLSRGGKSVAGQNVATTAKNVIAKAKYGRQEKMAEAGRKALQGEGAVGPSSTSKLEALREKKSALKQARKETGVKVGKEIRDVKKGIRYEKKVMRGKNVYKR
jgi:hypothetical protein